MLHVVVYILLVAALACASAGVAFIAISVIQLVMERRGR